MAANEGMHTYAARLATFETPHQLSKRRASGQGTKKKGPTTAEWPHANPTPEDLARAGFFFKPGPDSLDNVQCFLCSVKLDGWEAEDDPLSEHLAHSAACNWATTLSVSAREGQEPEARNPMSDQMVEARRATYEVGDGWIHEGKRGWKCKIAKMVDAGWSFDPSPDNEDGVTCFYCALSLDGWEPKDDPLLEHRKREPDCPFFTLCGLYGNLPGAEGKGKGRTSTASKVSRLSTQSAMSQFSEAPSLASLGDLGPTIDDSAMTTGTNASQATIRGAKKVGRPKAPAKTTGAKKKAVKMEDVDEALAKSATTTQSQQIVDLSMDELSQPSETQDSAPPARTTRKGKRSSKQVDSSIVETSQVEVAPKKATRGRKIKAQVEAAAEEIDVSTQLQDELENSLMHDEVTPQSIAVKPTRGAKRTSTGTLKEEQITDISKAAKKSKQTRKPSKQVTVPEQPEPEEGDLSLAEFGWMTKAGTLGLAADDEDSPKPAPKAKKGPAKKGRPKKASSVRSSKAIIVSADAEADQIEEDLARDEREIEAELERIAAEQAEAQSKAIQVEQEKAQEFEPSPSPRYSRKMQVLEDEAQAEDQGERTELAHQPTATPSPTQSDKENIPSSVAPSSAKAAPAVLSPTSKTTRIPLAPGTPNRSPRKAGAASPSKHLSQLQSSHPWTAADLDAGALLASPISATPGSLATRLSNAAGTLTSPEKHMTVEQWIRWRAEQSEEALRTKCEEMVGVFETEGMRALQSLTGIQTI
ncbi:Hypothetical protein R9X50_00281900 [Acrodontium crateriforme]|uniref:BIR-domain-containing protein n=1 Tax=Acrodontium crateriforme TaxID=150365 RepID=A0AAQ3M534_9PEZI|nr:Hypothetical protein R9X50_00281900 [Acrodontium crateriforme]